MSKYKMIPGKLIDTTMSSKPPQGMYNSDNITDDIAEQLLAVHPGYRKYFESYDTPSVTTPEVKVSQVYKGVNIDKKEIQGVKIGILIPTRGDRSAFLKMAKTLIGRQTVKHHVLLILDDPPKSEAPDITYRYRVGCDRLFAEGCDVVVWWEDDDWYAPNYLERMVSAWIEMGKPDIFGLDKTLYYHLISQKYLHISHPGRASAMSTMVTKAILDIAWCDDNYSYTDIHVWAKLKGKAITISEVISVGIKHGVGLTGGGGHKQDWNKYNGQDVNYEYLERIVGDDVRTYQTIIKANQYDYRKVLSAKKDPFLTIITRCLVNQRPKGFAQHSESIKKQTSKDYEQIFIEDSVGYGMHESNQSFEYVREMVDGDYVYLLDDDDFLKTPKFISTLKAIVKKHKPDVIFFKMIILNGAYDCTYPTWEVWDGVKPLKAGHIGGSCFVFTKAIYDKYIEVFGQPRMGDFSFIDTVMKDKPKVYWHDEIMAETSRIGRGTPE